jgi:hypothetical protein
MPESNFIKKLNGIPPLAGAFNSERKCHACKIPLQRVPAHVRSSSAAVEERHTRRTSRGTSREITGDRAPTQATPIEERHARGASGEGG